MQSRAQGWTLVEMITVLVMFAVLAAFGSTLISRVFLSYFTARDITSTDAQARVAFERMTRDLRQVRSATANDLDIASGAQVRFIDSDGNGACFYRDAATSRLMRSADGPTSACGTTSPQPLADYVTGLSFFYYATDMSAPAGPPTVSYITVHVDVTNNNVVDTLRATIHPRTFP